MVKDQIEMLKVGESLMFSPMNDNSFIRGKVWKNSKKSGMTSDRKFEFTYEELIEVLNTFIIGKIQPTIDGKIQGRENKETFINNDFFPYIEIHKVPQDYFRIVGCHTNRCYSKKDIMDFVLSDVELKQFISVVSGADQQ